MEALSFDTVRVDTQLAEDYLKNNDELIHLILNKSSYVPPLELIEDRIQEPMRKKIETLIEKIEENAQLFTQLEVLKRGLPVDDVKNRDIKLLVQHLKFVSAIPYTLEREFTSIHTFMSKDFPLANLGLVVQFLKHGINYVVILCDEVILPVCLLFAQLCSYCGLHVRVSLTYREEYKMLKTHVYSQKCAGVVTEQSDLDSAVDTFLASTTKYPWKLGRLFIQESVYERFSKALAWKCDLKEKLVENKETIKAVCSQIHIYGDKAFLFNCTETPAQEETKHVILVEAYRTVKELLSLIKESDAFCLSLWSSDLAETNKITFATNVPIVWVNDYGSFDGPPRASQGYYNRFDGLCNVDFSAVEKFNQNYKNWLKLTVEDRSKKVKDALIGISNQYNKDKSYITSLIKAISNLRSNKFIEIDNERLCIQIDNPRGIVHFTVSDNDFDFQSVVESVIYGNGIIWYPNECNSDFNLEDRQLLESFQAMNIPICKVEPKYVTLSSSKKSIKLKLSMSLYETRVIYTNFSTTFAN